MNALKKINIRAKQLRKANKNLSHRDAIKKASADYRAGRINAAPKKVAAVKKVARKKVAGKKKVGGFRKMPIVNGIGFIPMVGGVRSSFSLSQIKELKDKIHTCDAIIWKVRNTKKAGLSINELKNLHSQKTQAIKEKAIYKKALVQLKKLI